MVHANKYARNASDAAAKALNGGSDVNLGDSYFAPAAVGGNGALVSALAQGLTDSKHVAGYTYILHYDCFGTNYSFVLFLVS